MNIVAVHFNHARIRAQLPAYQSQQRGFAGATRTHDGGNFSAWNRQTDIIENDSRFAAKSNVTDGDNGGGTQSAPLAYSNKLWLLRRSVYNTTMIESATTEIADKKLCETARRVIRIEAEAVANLSLRIGESFVKTCDYLLRCKGRVILIGMGKSGHIARKIAATLASTGTASYFVHPAEANHGDLGMLAPGDTIIAISNSGETNEILTLLPIIKLLNIPMIAMTGNAKSILAQYATIHLDISVNQEACPLGLAPTSSTTTALVMGDAIALALLEARGFQANDFARYHPGGALGRRLLLQIDKLMHTGEQLPVVTIDCLLSDALLEMTRKSLGMTTVVDTDGKLCGIFTDGDLRRSLDQNVNVHQTKIADIMTKNSVTITKNCLAAEALQLMEQRKITSLVVLDNEKPVGVVHMHDLLRAGIG